MGSNKYLKSFLGTVACFFISLLIYAYAALFAGFGGLAYIATPLAYMKALDIIFTSVYVSNRLLLLSLGGLVSFSGFLLFIALGAFHSFMYGEAFKLAIRLPFLVSATITAVGVTAMVKFDDLSARGKSTEPLIVLTGFLFSALLVGLSIFVFYGNSR